MFTKKYTILFFILVLGLYLVFSLDTFEKTSNLFALDKHSKDIECHNYGNSRGERGYCIELDHDVPGGDCSVKGKKGYIVPGLCKSRTAMNYRCCVVDEGDDPVTSNRGCEELGGDCRWTTNEQQSCTLLNGDVGCFVSSVCRTQEQAYSENQVYRCCAPLDWCEGGVGYEYWNDIFFEGDDCPFSVANPGETRLHCSQGPYTSPSHQAGKGKFTSNAVDIRHVDAVEFGTEWFRAPDDGCVVRAVMEKDQCGGLFVFKTDAGITYTVDHAFLLTSLQKGYDEVTGSPLIEERCFNKGVILAKVALATDKIVKDPANCPPHFHVGVEGTDKCADCHFVDDLNCNLRNPGPQCGDEQVRCYRELSINNNCDCGTQGSCVKCSSSSIQHCCEKDVVIKDGKPVCK